MKEYTNCNEIMCWKEKFREVMHMHFRWYWRMYWGRKYMNWWTPLSVRSQWLSWNLQSGRQDSTFYISQNTMCEIIRDVPLSCICDMRWTAWPRIPWGGLAACQGCWGFWFLSDNPMTHLWSNSEVQIFFWAHLWFICGSVHPFLPPSTPSALGVKLVPLRLY